MLKKKHGMNKTNQMPNEKFLYIDFILIGEYIRLQIATIAKGKK